MHNAQCIHIIHICLPTAYLVGNIDKVNQCPTAKELGDIFRSCGHKWASAQAESLESFRGGKAMTG